MIIFICSNLSNLQHFKSVNLHIDAADLRKLWQTFQGDLLYIVIQKGSNITWILINSFWAMWTSANQFGKKTNNQNGSAYHLHPMMSDLFHVSSKEQTQSNVLNKNFRASQSYWATCTSFDKKKDCKFYEPFQLKGAHLFEQHFL